MIYNFPAFIYMFILTTQSIIAFMSLAVFSHLYNKFDEDYYNFISFLGVLCEMYATGLSEGMLFREAH